MPDHPTVLPRKLPIQGRSRVTVDTVLQAATYILIEDGYAKLTTNRVAERAGVNIASLYQYFPNKEALVFEIQRRHVEETRAVSQAAIEARRGQGLETAAQAMIEACIAAHSVNPALHRVLAEELPRLPSDPAQKVDREPMLAAMRNLSEETGCNHAEAERRAWMAWTILLSVVHRGMIERADDFQRGILECDLKPIIVACLRPSARQTK